MVNFPGENLKILLTIRSMAHGGGAESLVFNIYNELKRRPRVKVKLLAFQRSELSEGKDTNHFERQLAGDPDFHFCNSYVNLSILGRNSVDTTDYVRIANEFKPHIVHSHLFIAELISREAIFPAAKYLTHTHDNMKQLKNFSLKTLTRKEWATDFYEKLHLVKRYVQCDNNFISISADTTRYFRDSIPSELRRNIFPLDNAIVTDVFNAVDKPRQLDRIRILNVGSFYVKKNQRFLLDIAGELIKRTLPVEIVMLGDGPLYGAIKQQVESRVLQGVISMPGNIVNVYDYYGAANIYVHTATYEPFGLVLVEAMAAGLPVVSLDGQGNRALVENGVNGYMLQEQDPVKFADAIEKIITNRTLYESMHRNALRMAGKYDIKPYVDKLLAIYENVAR